MSNLSFFLIWISLIKKSLHPFEYLLSTFLGNDRLFIYLFEFECCFYNSTCMKTLLYKENKLKRLEAIIVPTEIQTDSKGVGDELPTLNIYTYKKK